MRCSLNHAMLFASIYIGLMIAFSSAFCYTNYWSCLRRDNGGVIVLSRLRKDLRVHSMRQRQPLLLRPGGGYYYLVYGRGVGMKLKYDGSEAEVSKKNGPASNEQDTATTESSGEEDPWPLREKRRNENDDDDDDDEVELLEDYLFLDDLAEDDNEDEDKMKEDPFLLSKEQQYETLRALEDEALLQLLDRVDNDNDNDNDNDKMVPPASVLDKDDLSLFLWTLDEGDYDDVNIYDVHNQAQPHSSADVPRNNPSPLEQALLQGVVPADAGVGSQSLPGDYGLDPFNLSTKDYFKQVQRFMLNLLPGNHGNTYLGTEASSSPSTLNHPQPPPPPRPTALILRDYREAEIRHGRLAMLAAILWPLQEIIDHLFLPPQYHHFTVVYGGVTLPYLSLLITLIMLLLGYLDIYANAIKDQDTGEAFLPGECFWDPLAMLQGAPEPMKWNMQQRELFFGRIAMMAVLLYFVEEAITHKPLVSLPFNDFFFHPLFQIPAVQMWLDHNFQTASPVLSVPMVMMI